MKLIIQRDHTGDVYVYRESKSMYREMKNVRAGRRRTLSDLDEECYLKPGEFVVANLKKGQK